MFSLHRTIDTDVWCVCACECKFRMFTIILTDKLLFCIFYWKVRHNLIIQHVVYIYTWENYSYIKCIISKSTWCAFIQLCPIFCKPMDCSPQGSSVHGIFQARVLKRVAISDYRQFFRLRNWTFMSSVSCISRQILYHWATKEVSILYWA